MGRTGASPVHVGRLARRKDTCLNKLPSQPKKFVPHQVEWHGQLAARMIHLLGSGLAETWRMKWVDQSGEFDGKHHGPLIFCIWHNRLALSMEIWRGFVRKRRHEKGLAALISASRDGGLLARSLEHFDVQPVRGSSSRRGAQALLELTTWIDKGCHVAITPDGPRGPRYHLKEGIISLAQLTGHPILPVGVQISPKTCLKSWDKFQIPLPLARCTVTFAKPVRVPSDTSESDREKLRISLENQMRELNRD